MRIPIRIMWDQTVLYHRTIWWYIPLVQKAITHWWRNIGRLEEPELNYIWTKKEKQNRCTIFNIVIVIKLVESIGAINSYIYYSRNSQTVDLSNFTSSHALKVVNFANNLNHSFTHTFVHSSINRWPWNYMGVSNGVHTGVSITIMSYILGLV